MSETQRENSLKEWCGRLPECHRVNQELLQLRETIGLLNSMVLCGDKHSDQSQISVEKACAVLSGKL